MRTRILAVALTTAVTVGLLAGCGGQKPAEPTTTPAPKAESKPAEQKVPAAATPAATKPAPAPTPPKNLGKWKNGVLTAKGDAGFQFMAAEKGFFKEQGLDVEMVQVGTDPNLLKAMLAGELDSMEVTPASTLNAIESGGKLKVIGATMAKLTFTVVSTPDIQSMKDLEGQPLAITGVGGLLHTVALALLQQEGADPKKVSFVSLRDVAGAYQAVLAGQAKAAVVSNDFVPQVAKSGGKVKVLLDVGNRLPNYLRVGLITSDKVIKERPEALLAFMMGQAKGIRYAVKNRDEELALTRKLTGIPADNKGPESVWEDFTKNKRVAASLEVEPAAIELAQEINIQIGRQKQKLPLSDVLDLSFQKKVAEALGPFQW